MKKKDPIDSTVTNKSVEQQSFSGWRPHAVSLCLLMLFFLSRIMSVSAEFTVNAADHGSIAGALDAIPENAGEVIVYLAPGAPETDISIPADRGISSLQFLPAEGAERVLVTGSLRICANGVPFTLGEGIQMPDASIYGGNCASEGEHSLEKTSVTIAGAAGFVFGGSFAENGASVSTAETSVTVTETGLVYYEVFGGGHAFGSGSRTSSEYTAVNVMGTTDYALGGGFAENGAHSEVTRTEMFIAETANIPVALFTGGSASGTGSLSILDNAKAVLEGYANWAFSGDFAFNGGETRLTRSSRLEITASGGSEQAYLGSFSSAPGSLATVNTSELMNCGTVSRIIKDGQSTDGGQATTQVPANFPCTSK